MPVLMRKSGCHVRAGRKERLRQSLGLEHRGAEIDGGQKARWIIDPA